MITELLLLPPTPAPPPPTPPPPPPPPPRGPENHRLGDRDTLALCHLSEESDLCVLAMTCVC